MISINEESILFRLSSSKLNDLKYCIFSLLKSNFKEVNINFYDIGDKNRIKKSHKIKNLLGPKNSQKAIFLDRDGTLIEDNIKYLHKIKHVKFILKTLNFIRKNNSFRRIFIVTNQSGLGRKFFSLKMIYTQYLILNL